MALAYGVRLLGLMEKPVTLAGLEDMIARRDATEPHLKRLSGTDPGYSVEQILRGVRQQQFVPFYQPKVALATGRVLGMEALARWHHPAHGLGHPACVRQCAGGLGRCRRAYACDTGKRRGCMPADARAWFRPDAVRESLAGVADRHDHGRTASRTSSTAPGSILVT